MGCIQATKDTGLLLGINEPKSGHFATHFTILLSHTGQGPGTQPGPPNDLRISCGLSYPRPHKPTFRFVLEGRTARAELGTLRPVGCMRGLGASLAERLQSILLPLVPLTAPPRLWRRRKPHPTVSPASLEVEYSVGIRVEIKGGLLAAFGPDDP